MKKQLETEIEINAPAERVWKVLTDFHAHPIWNPFIKELRGKPAVGEKLRVFIQPPDGKGMVFKPTVLKADENRELRWLGKLFISGLFDGEHYFRIEPIDENRVRFIHGEIFSGLRFNSKDAKVFIDVRILVVKNPRLSEVSERIEGEQRRKGRDKGGEI